MELNSAIFFMGLCLFSPMLFSICVSILDMFDKPKVITKEVVRIEYVDRVIVQEKQIKKKIKEKESPVKADCIECLISLGMKKSVARSKVDEMWAVKNYNSVESFLMDAYRV